MTDELAARVDVAAAAVAGVTRVYPARAHQVIGAGARSTVRRIDDTLSVEVCIGVDGDPAEVGARVSDAVRASLAEHPSVEVAVRISRVR